MRSKWLVLVLSVCVLLFPANDALQQHSRRVLNLDGQWNFALSDPPMNGSITVPGSWESQGYGQDAVSMRWQVLNGDEAHGATGASGVYSKKAHPACATGERAILMVDGWIHRHAVFKVDGDVVGSHRGYLTPFEVDITSQAADGEVDIEITVDGGRNPSNDALMGASDLDTAFGESLGGWVGLNGHVMVECRPHVFIDLGIASVMPPHVSHAAVNASSEGQPLDINVSFSVGTKNVWAKVGISGAGLDKSHEDESPEVASYAQITTSGSQVVQVQIPAVVLWYVESPVLYNVTISLHMDKSAPAIDTAWTRFGVRTVTVDGGFFTLNGRRLFLNGYGDDAVYPITISPPRDKGTYAKRLAEARELGFNFARHHSTTLPVEFFEAADEAGLLVSPEMPCAYPYVQAGAGLKALELYTDTWKSRILQLRNHPSILVWSECNEATFPAKLLDPMYKTAKELDPTRLVLEIDGGYSTNSQFESRQFPLGSQFAWGVFEKLGPNPYYDKCDANGTCSFNAVPFRPIISHETGNYAGFPRLSSLLQVFESSNTSIKPTWLDATVDKLKGIGALGEAENWAAASEYLYGLCWKIDIEDLRHNKQMSGYEWWCLQDFWRGANGIYDIFMRPKPGVSFEAIKSFNAPTILLQSGLKLAYAGGDAMHVIVSASNFGPADIRNGTLRLTLKTSSTILLQKKVKISAPGVKQGEYGVLDILDVTLPDIGTTNMPKSTPLQVQLVAHLETKGQTVPKNTWNTTVLPRWIDSPTPADWTLYVTEPDLMLECGYNNCQIAPLLRGPQAEFGKTQRQIWNASSQTPQMWQQELMERLTTTANARLQWNGGVYLARDVSEPLMSAVLNGSVAVVIPKSVGGFFPTDTTKFKQSWWTGGVGPGDNNAGVIVYPSAEKILGNMTIDGFPDQAWYHLIDGAQTFLMEDITPLDPSHTQIDSLIRAIDIFGQSRSKSLLFQMKVGKGAILGCGLNVLQAKMHSPQMSWILTRLLAYAGEMFANGTASPSKISQIIEELVDGTVKLPQGQSLTAEQQASISSIKSKLGQTQHPFGMKKDSEPLWNDSPTRDDERPSTLSLSTVGLVGLFPITAAVAFLAGRRASRVSEYRHPTMFLEVPDEEIAE